MALTGREIKEAALIGFRHRRDEIREQIRQLERELGGRDGQGRDGTGSAPGRKKRVLSAAARQRIAAAQRKRWAAARAQKNPPARTKISAAKRRPRVGTQNER
jgi:hypothetical protein